MMSTYRKFIYQFCVYMLKNCVNRYKSNAISLLALSVSSFLPLLDGLYMVLDIRMNCVLGQYSTHISQDAPATLNICSRYWRGAYQWSLLCSLLIMAAFEFNAGNQQTMWRCNCFCIIQWSLLITKKSKLRYVFFRENCFSPDSVKWQNHTQNNEIVNLSKFSKVITCMVV